MPISRWQTQFAAAAAGSRVFVLDWPREVLYQRIDRRVEAMFAAGLVDEVRSLLARPRPLSRTASQGLGYREVIDYLSGGPELSQTIDLVKTHTRQFAKRQGTWFRSLSECRFVGVGEPFDLAAVAAQLLATCDRP